MRLNPVVLSLTAGFLAAMSAAQTPSTQEMGLLPGDRGVGPAINSQADVAAAAGLGSTLVVWTDFRSRSSGSHSIQSDGDILGLRIDRNGQALDAVPFVIAGGMGLQQRPMVAFNGENWLVIFQSQDPVGGYFGTVIRGVRVSPAGAPLDNVPLALPAVQFDPSTIGLTLAGQGGQWMIVRCIYHDTGYGTFLAGQRIGADGQVIDATPRMLLDWVYGSLQIVARGGEYLVAGPDWTSSSTTKAQRVSAAGAPLGSPFNLPSNFVALAASPTEYYVTWLPNATTTLLGSRMSAAGTLLTPAGTPLVTNFSSGGTTMMHDGTNWWLAWSISNQARTMRINPAGSALDPGGVALPISVTGNVNSLYSPAIVAAPGGGGATFVWTDFRAALNNDANAFALPITAANVAGMETCVSTGTPSQRNSDLAIGPGGTVAVAMVSETAAQGRVLVHLLDVAGRSRSPEPVEVAAAPSIGRVGIAFNGAAYMVAWDQATTPGLTPVQIRARRLNAQGEFIDAAPFDVMPGFNAAIEALGGNFLISGARFGTYPQNIFLFGSRVDGATAALLDGPSGILLGGGYVSGAPRVRTDGVQWFVAAHSQWTHDSSQGDAILARVPAVGAPSPAFNPTPYAGGTGDLDIAFSGSNALLVWRTNTLSNANNYISGRIMNTDGTFTGSAFTIAEAPGRQLRPTVVWDGVNYLVAWEDQRNQASFFDARTEIYAVRVSPTGSVIDPAAFVLVDRTGFECSPSLIRQGGAVYIGSSRFVADGTFDSYRVGVSIVGSIPCPADFTGDGTLSLQDLFDFLAAYFSSQPAADINGSGSITIQDLFDYLAAYFSGCG